MSKLLKSDWQIALVMGILEVWYFPCHWRGCPAPSDVGF